MKTYPNYPQFILVSEFSGRGQYQNVNVAHIDYEQTTAERPVYKLNDNQTPVPVPHLAPENKDWQWLGDKWLLIDDYANMPVYSKASGQRIAPPLFGEALTDDMTLKTPPSESGKITYFDAKANDWAMREDLSGKQVFSTTDPSQSLVLGREDWAVPDGYTETPAPSPAHVWDAKKSAWLLDKAKQAELDAQANQAAFDKAKTDKAAEINNKAQSYIDHATGADQLPAFEVQSWSIQGAEAKAWKADPSAPTPTLESIAKNRGVPVDALRAGAYKKTMMFEAISATVTGQRQKYSDQLRAAKTLADIEAINVIYG